MPNLIILCDAVALPGFRPSAGFACLIQPSGKNVLLDTGPHISTLLHNMGKLSLHPLDISAIVLSHNDSDHAGALFDLLHLTNNVEVYLLASSPARFKERIAAAGAVVKEVYSPTLITEDLTSTGEMGDSPSEQSLVLSGPTGPALVVGCGHPGLVEIVRKAAEIAGAPLRLVCGGFHLEGASAAEIEAAALELQRSRVKTVAPCHCTGEKALGVLRRAFGDNLIACGSGKVMEVERACLNDTARPQ